MEVLENVVLDADTETFLFIDTLPRLLGIEVACTDLLGVKSIVHFLRHNRCLEHVDQSYASLRATHKSSFVPHNDFSSANEVKSHAYDEVLSFDDVNLHEESCVKEDSFTYMCGKVSNIIAYLDPCLDNCRDEGLSSSMCWSYMPWNDFCRDVEDMHAIILDDVFLPPSDALSQYLDELWVRGPIWDCEMDSNHVCGIVGGTKVPTCDSFDCELNMACSQNKDYGTFVANDDDDGWGFNEPLIEDNLSMASYVQKAQERNKAEEDIMADMDTRVLMDACDGRGAMKVDMDAMFDKMVVVHTDGWCMLYPFDPGAIKLKKQMDEALDEALDAVCEESTNFIFLASVVDCFCTLPIGQVALALVVAVATLEGGFFGAKIEAIASKKRKPLESDMKVFNGSFETTRRACIPLH
ncbi:hypothetical protein L7F22_040850 [Adiantum nelumboides]|nr:hypothetical protein [Adiantum nelumboides]